MDSSPLEEFEGTERFAVQRKLGSGTSGSVYEVYDREKKAILALKTLRQVDAAALYRFKKEFRALSDVDHRNLVQLYELLSDGQRWFFTMELVKGQTFLEYVRQDGYRGAVSVLEDEAPTLLGREAAALLEEQEKAGARQGDEPRSADGLPFRADRLRLLMRQLAEGLVALHDAGKLHCDIKPTNVMVTRSGRLVLLDLGLVRDLGGHRVLESLDEDIVGTPAYMSPEQGAGIKVTPASDWYSAGAMLYEALTGRIPYVGSVMKILTDKQRLDPPPPRQLLEGVPEDLDTLCRALLHRDPEERPSGRDVLRWLGGDDPTPASAFGSRQGSSSTTASPFVGREREMETLLEAFQKTRVGRAVAVFVHGTSGMGKTALVRRFLDELHHEDDRVVVLTGRCYQRESVPYKALDSLVDALSRYLRGLPHHEAELLLPYDVLALARLFPVLKRVKAVAGARRRVLEIPDSQEIRRRAFGALRELFQRLCDKCPVVLVIDDLQWGDLDSASLLNELLRPPDPPPLMLVAMFRSEEAITSPLLRSLFSSKLAREVTEVRELVVRELSMTESRMLALRLLGDASPTSRALAETIAKESDGNPFFVDALVRYVQTMAEGDRGDRGGEGATELQRAVGEATLEKVIAARLARLPGEARRLLEVVAVAGQPVDLEVATQAAELEEATHAPLAALRAASLVRIRSGREREQLESYHDRIREVVVKLLEPEAQRAYHRRLALALQASGRADPETLAIHFEEGGQRDRAADFATQAADQAADALAFDRAARLYRIARDLASGTSSSRAGADRRQLEIKLGNALANAGRGAEAAQAYLAAAEGAKAADALELRRRAAEQLLISGRIDKGLATVRHVLKTIGMKLADTPRQALFSLVRRRLQLKMRGIGFKERDSTQISAEELIKIDTCWSVSVGLGLVDIIRGNDFGTLHVLLALKAGEPYRVARALAICAGYSATSGRKATARTAELSAAAMSLAEKVGHPHALGLATMTSGMAAYLEGHWMKARELFNRAEEMLRERCTGVTWEIDNTFLFHLRSLLMLGHYGEICRRLPTLLKDVAERGDLYAETGLRCRFSWIAWLVTDEPKMAEEEVDSAIARWSDQGFTLQHYWHLTGKSEIAMYAGRGLEAWTHLEARWEDLEKSLLLRIQFTRTEAFHLRARCALAAAVAAGGESEQARSLKKVLDADLRKVEGERLGWADPLARLVRAGLAASEGRREEAMDLLSKAEEEFVAADMNLYAATARLRRGQLRGSAGREEVAAAEALLRAEGIRKPLGVAAFLAPGEWA